MNKDTLKVDFSKRKITGEVSAVLFKEGEHFIFFCPSLDISSYADNANDAKKFFFEVYLEEFFSSIIRNPKRGMKELSLLGWKKDRLFPKNMYADAYVDIEGVLKEFNIPKETVIKEEKITV